LEFITAEDQVDEIQYVKNTKQHVRNYYSYGWVVLIDSATMSDLAAISSLFILMGSVCIVAYFIPVIFGKLDDRRNRKIEA